VHIYQRSKTKPLMPPVHVYQAYYAASPEKAAFQAAVSRESSMFGDLIRAKQHLVLPIDMGQDSLKQVRCIVLHSLWLCCHRGQHARKHTHACHAASVCA
jgi:hypothetical protein